MGKLSLVPCASSSITRVSCSPLCVDSSLKKKTAGITSALSAFLLLPLTPSFFSFDLSSAHQKEPSAMDAKLSQENIGYFLK